MVRSSPSLIASFVYIWAAWVMEVTVNLVARWFLLFASLSGFVVVAIDQLKLAYDHRGDALFKLKLGLIIYSCSPTAAMP